MEQTSDIAAGRIDEWLAMADGVARGERDAAVPCGSCTACCTGSQFVHIAPDEADTLAHIPAELLAPAPLMPRGHLVLGYDERGHCPMLRDGACSIYAHRPRTCRVYDCRAFVVAGVDPDVPEIDRRIARWRFDEPSEEEMLRVEAVRAALRRLLERPDLLAGGLDPPSASRLVGLAVRIHGLFLNRGSDGLLTPSDPSDENLAAAVGSGARPPGGALPDEQAAEESGGPGRVNLGKRPDGH